VGAFEIGIVLLGRGAGISVNPLQPAGFRESVISGSPEQIADAVRSFRKVGFTQADLMVGPGTVEAFDAMAPVLELLRAD
jgi:alkanesulfonate monooxygenase SsuD/methylene tetrahydromethanopterin reductase-like flavin-dependent oxidoreductase (luciferase family)